ncbi:spore germination protein [Paenibacillus sp. CF384]|uniref:spore germination protein n=1 Tax=Paenibacillus sp. CF384 TaxID=1884382 RepID=UPI0008958763|nr:spore germination protein [Paenibacillus sp. CF384]SDX84320.1 GerA spore germination protein [Paenibacillus sp. CF384]
MSNKPTKTDDWNTYRLALQERTYHIEWLSSMVDLQMMRERFLPMLQLHKPRSSEDMRLILPFENIEIRGQFEKHALLLKGYISVTIETAGVAHPDVLYLPCKKSNYRGIEEPKEEFSEAGPLEAFTESLETNSNMIRRRLVTEQLQVRNLTLGSAKTPASIFYLAESQILADRLTYQVEQASIDHPKTLLDISNFAMRLPNGKSTFFPPYEFTELPLHAIHMLESGKVILVMEGSRKALIAPTSFEDSFVTVSDLFLSHNYVVVIRVVRVFSFIMALTLTPLYVAVNTYHFQIFSIKLIETMLISRYQVPFSAFFEALIMELLVLIQLEAVTRLPTKLSQSAGIVAGIVLGSAAVEAGLVSNVMLVMVAVSALFTLTSASVQMRNFLFVLKIPCLILAQLYGMTGIGLFWFLMLSRMFAVRSLDQPFALFGLLPFSRYLKGKE